MLGAAERGSAPCWACSTPCSQRTGTLIGIGFVPNDFVIAWRPRIVAVPAGVGLGVAGARDRWSQLVVRRVGPGRRPSKRLTAMPDDDGRGAAHRSRGRDRRCWSALWLALPTPRPERSRRVTVLLLRVGCVAWPVERPPPWLCPQRRWCRRARLAGVRVLGGLIRRTRAATTSPRAYAAAPSTVVPIAMIVGLVVGLAAGVDAARPGTLPGDVELLWRSRLAHQFSRRRLRLLALAGRRRGFSRGPLVVGVEVADDGGSSATIVFEGLALDPVTYQRTHRVTDVDGDLNKLRGATVVLLAARRTPRAVHRCRGAVPRRWCRSSASGRRDLPESLAGLDVLVPIDLRSAEHAELRYIVRTTPEGRAAAIRALVTLVHGGPSRVGEVLSVDEWVQITVAASGRTDRDVLVALLPR